MPTLYLLHVTSVLASQLLNCSLSLLFSRQTETYSAVDVYIAIFPGKTERYALYPPELFEQYVRLLGINNGDHLVLYDRGPMGGMLWASKLWWLFRVSTVVHLVPLIRASFQIYGHEGVSLLNGGFSAWMSHGLEVTDEVTEVEVPSYSFPYLSPLFFLRSERRLEGAKVPSGDVHLVRRVDGEGQQRPGLDRSPSTS